MAFTLSQFQRERESCYLKFPFASCYSNAVNLNGMDHWRNGWWWRRVYCTLFIIITSSSAIISGIIITANVVNIGTIQSSGNTGIIFVMDGDNLLSHIFSLFFIFHKRSVILVNFLKQFSFYITKYRMYYDVWNVKIQNISTLSKKWYKKQLFTYNIVLLKK